MNTINLACRIFWTVLSASLCLAASALDKPAVETAEQIIDRVVKRHATRSEVGVLGLTVISSEGAVQQRTLLGAVKVQSDGRVSYLFRFLEPESIAGVSLLTLEDSEGKAEQYLHLPQLGAPRKVVAGQRAGSFAGSDFTYEDLRKEDPRLYKYHRLIDDEYNGRMVYTIMAAPVNIDILEASSYSHRILYIDRETADIVKVEVFEPENNSPVKVMEVEGYGSAVESVKRPTRVVMRNLEQGSTSVLTLKSTGINIDIPDRFFTVDTLAAWTPEDTASLQMLSTQVYKE